jgi:hypothetical protein
MTTLSKNSKKLKKTLEIKSEFFFTSP